jgi:hypothetical protein
MGKNGFDVGWPEILNSLNQKDIVIYQNLRNNPREQYLT